MLQALLAKANLSECESRMIQIIQDRTSMCFPLSKEKPISVNKTVQETIDKVMASKMERRQVEKSELRSSLKVAELLDFVSVNIM
jgi:hypothetical protein